MEMEQFNHSDNFFVSEQNADGEQEYFIGCEPDCNTPMHVLSEPVSSFQSEDSMRNMEENDSLFQYFTPKLKSNNMSDVNNYKHSSLHNLQMPEMTDDSVYILPDDLLPANSSMETDALWDSIASVSSPVSSQVKEIKKEKQGSQDVVHIMQLLDIQSPIHVLRTLLEEKLNRSLLGWPIWLQNAQLLHQHKNLAEQCIVGEGDVLVNVEFSFGAEKKINIIDVLKPGPEDYLNHAKEKSTANNKNVTTESNLEKKSAKNDDSVRWVPDVLFKSEMERHNVPDDPQLWDNMHVKLWILWAVRRFNIKGIKLRDWYLTGKELCNMTLKEFREKVPEDHEDLFWTHIELLRKCHIVAVREKDKPSGGDDREDINSAVNKLIKNEGDKSQKKGKLIKTETESGKCLKKGQNEDILSAMDKLLGKDTEQVGKSTKKVSRILGTTHIITEGSNRSGNNGQVQLWRFLLDILTDKHHRDKIEWTSDDGEFRLTNPDLVADLWGERKGKVNMNYEKLSRALRYYYDGDMIAKVPGKRFTYKFICDLKELLGYNASELNAKVTQLALKEGVTTTFKEYYEHPI